MSFDLSQFNQLFFEETAEHLATMESLMLNMDVQAPDMDDLNAVFRAAHSIKGNSGTFGFHDMTDVTHELETLLDLVRKGEADLTDEMVDVTLQAGDVLKGLLESHQEGGEADLEPSKAVIAELDVQLAKAKGEVSPKSSVVNESSSGVIAASEQIDASLSHTAEAYETNVNQSFIIRFPDPGDDTSMLFDSLKELGELSIIDSPESGGDDWLFSLQTESQKKDIRELVEFLVPPEGISIDEELNADDGSFGFFEDVSNISEPSDNDLGYGFFDDIDLKGDASEDPGYGFFDSQDEAVTEESVVADEDLGYGFFEDLDSQAPSDEITGVIDAEVIANSSDNALDKINTSNTEKDKGEGEAQAEFDGYGFF
jgi:two-component system chemotaxis sensor kinase CheA